MERVPFDPELLKARTRDQWDQAAAGWYDKRDQIRAWLREPTRAMLDLAAIAPGAHVLDVAAGAGDQTLDLAERVGSAGIVLATDISPLILQFARENARRAGYRNVDVQVADGERLGVPCMFDAAICRLGLMFYPDPLAGLREIFDALKPGGRACTLVFSEATRNPCIMTTMAAALKHTGRAHGDPDAPGGLFSLGRPGVIDALFRQAGFVEVQTTTLPAPITLPSAGHYVDFIRTSAGPIRDMIGPLDAPARQAAWDDMAQRLACFDTRDGWEGPNELLLTAGTR
jgi:ubiquinone/menaquinone biosynthesis C-methylase UbiE